MIDGRHERGSTGLLALGVGIGAAFLLTILLAFGQLFIAHAELQQASDIAAASLTRPRGAGIEPRVEARSIAAANGARSTTIDELDAGTRIRVRVAAPAPGVLGVAIGTSLHAESIVRAPALAGATAAGMASGSGGAYAGPLVSVDSVRICPAVGSRYLAMQAAARRSGVVLSANSGYRSYAEQAALYASLGPRLAAPPGTSLHHAATELDLNVGPAGSSIHRWLQANAPGFGFVQRYSWEPWHWGNVRGC